MVVNTCDSDVDQITFDNQLKQKKEISKGSRTFFIILFFFILLVYLHVLLDSSSYICTILALSWAYGHIKIETSLGIPDQI